jgi:hypothetical protein
VNPTFDNKFDASQSSFHTGSGPQYVYYQFSGAGRDSPESRSRPLASDFLAGLRRRFAHPEGFATARRTLRDTHTVLIAGEPGGGRNAAARMLLYEYRDLRPNLHEVLAEDEAGNVRLDPRPAGEPEGLLLDLSEADEESWKAVHESLPGFHASVLKNGSRLAVVLPNRLSDTLHSDLTRLRAVISRPDDRLVLRGALREAGLYDAQEPDGLPDELERFLRYRPPLDHVVHLAWLVRTEAASGRSDKFAEWCRTAVAALTRRPEDVAQQVVSLEDGRLRALLLTTAMLHGARSDAVYEACEALLATVDHPADDRPLLEREDLSSQFADIRAIPDAQGRVTFTEMDYDIAIRTHFWNNMPGIRSQLGDWVGKAVALTSLTARDRLLLAERFAEQTLRTSGPEDLLKCARDWADQGGLLTRPAAARALSYGALHRDHGRKIRRELYEWAISPALSGARADVLLSVCSGALASRHPEQAMVRLHHMSRHHSRGRDAESRLIRLALPDHRLHRRMLERLARDLRRSRAADIRLFSALSSPRHLTRLRAGPSAGPHALLDERGVREQLSTCWAALLESVPLAEWRDLPDQWLAAAAFTIPRHRDHLVDVMVRGCRGNPLHLGRLYQLAHPHRVAPLVQRKIDEVQGLGRSHS